jgi:hypothetical protein
MYNESMHKNILMMFVSPSLQFSGSSAEQQIIGWHMSHIYSQLPFTQLSYETVIVNPNTDSDNEIQQIMLELLKSGQDVSNHVVPCIYTNYKELKRPITSQIKPIFSYSEDMKKIMGSPYSGIVVISGKDAEKIQKKMGKELDIIMLNSLKQFKNFRILYNTTQETYGGVYFNIYLGNYFLFDHINSYDDDLVLAATRGMVTDCDILASQLTQYFLSRRLHQNNKVFQSGQGKKFIRVEENDSLISISIKHDILNQEIVPNDEYSTAMFSRDIDMFTDVANYFGLVKQISIIVENIDYKVNRFTTKFTIIATKKMTIDLATFEEFLYVLKKSYEFQIYNYVTYSDTELYKYSDFQPIDIKITPEI